MLYSYQPGLSRKFKSRVGLFSLFFSLSLVLGLLLSACDTSSQPLLICKIPAQNSSSITQAVVSPVSSPGPGGASGVNSPTPVEPPLVVPTVGGSAQASKDLDIVAQQACRVRNLNYTAYVSQNFMKREDLAKFQLDQFRRDNPPEYLNKYTKALEIFGFIPRGFDLEKAYVDLLTEQVLGFYDPQTKKLYIVVEDNPSKASSLAKFTTEHEMTHALQDQHFNLDKLRPQHIPGTVEGDDDRDLAITALLEGDAVNSQTLWLQEGNLTKVQLGELQDEVKKGSSDKLNNSPLILKNTLNFPYDQGYSFVQHYYGKGGWPTVNKIFTDYPPRSTAQILHFEKYDKKIEPVKIELPSLVETLGTGWKLFDFNTMGELQTRTLLAGGIPADKAEKAAGGWAGDRYQVFSNDQGQFGYVWLSQWDSGSQASDFYQAFNTYAAKIYDLRENEGSGSKKSWTSQGLEVSLIQKGNQVLVVVLPQGSGRDKVVTQLGF